MSKKVDFGVIKGSKSDKPLAEELERYRENLSFQFEMYELIARSRKKYFDELVESGFTEVQAMEIIKVTQI